MKFTHCAAFTFGIMGGGDILTTPAPNSYSLSTSLTKKHSPNYRFGSSSRENKVRIQSPGPGKYNVQSTFGLGPKYSIAHKDKPIKLFNGPGPGQYDSKQPRKNISYSMRRKPVEDKIIFIPGPGTYEIRSEKPIEVPTYKFGTEERNSLPTTATSFPGPGQYDTKTEFAVNAPKFSFGKEERGVERRPMTPGPSAYQTKRFVGNEGSKITISPCPRSAVRRSNFPGPGQYDPLLYVIKPQAPKYRIGTAKRRGLNDMGGSTFPGPNVYNPNGLSDSTRPKTPSWKIGTGKRPKLYSTGHVPGPGMYTLRHDNTNGPKYTISRKYKQKYKENEPGPGQYNNFSKTYYPNDPKWSIGSSTRDDVLKKVIKENYPGPGNYTAVVKPKSANSIKIGTEKRLNAKDNKDPGPGQYRIPCEFDNVNDYTRQQGNFDENFHYV